MLLPDLRTIFGKPVNLKSAISTETLCYYKIKCMPVSHHSCRDPLLDLLLHPRSSSIERNVHLIVKFLVIQINSTFGYFRYQQNLSTPKSLAFLGDQRLLKPISLWYVLYIGECKNIT